jgi:ABC-type nitrate/sulfonate/bicarbonate transport system substrate-binding protein
VAEVDKLGKVLTDYSPYDLQPIILAANKPVVDKNKDAVIAFMRGWLAAVKVYQDNRDEATAIVLKHFKDQGFSVTDKVIKLMLSKIDVTPDFGPQLKSYLTDEAKTLLAQNKIATMPNWDQRLNAGILAAARGKA